MPATWESVASNPAYQALPPDQKDIARQQYFDSVVAPQVPKEHLDIARQQFDSYSKEIIPKAHQQGFGQNIADTMGGALLDIGSGALGGLKNAATNTGEAISEPLNNPNTSGAMAIPDAIVRTIGKVGNAIGSPVEAAFGALQGGLTPAVEVTVPAQARGIASLTGQNPNLTPEQIHQLAQGEAGDLATTVGLGMAANQGTAMARQKAGLPPVEPPANPLSPIVDTVKSSNPVDFLKNTASGGADVLPTPPKSVNLSGDLTRAVDPVGMQAIEGINKAYSSAKDVVNNAETAVRKTPLPVNDSSLLDNLNNTIAKLSDKVAPGSDEQAALSRLTDIRDEIVSRTSDTKSTVLDANGKPFVKAPSTPITTNDLLDIQQSINAGLPDNKFLTSGNANKLGLKAQVKRLLNESATADPNFGSNLENYNVAAKDIATRFTGNKALKPLWQPEDHISWKAKQNNPAAPGYNDATLSRANEFLKNLNTDKTGRITAAIKALPPDVATQVLKAAKDRANSVNPSTVKAIAKGVAHTVINPVGGAREIISTLATKPKPNPINTFNEKMKYAKGGPVKKRNLTAEFLGRKYA